MTLFEWGFYKTLQLLFNYYPKYYYYSCNREQFSNAISTLRPTLVGLLFQHEHFVDSTRLTDLKRLHFDFISTTNAGTLAKSLTKLEQLSFLDTRLNDILQIVRHSKNLKTIKFLYLLGGHELDAFALNHKRRKYGNKHKVTIYVLDNSYLRANSMSRN